MIIVRPTSVTDTILDSTNVAETDDTEWNVATAYSIGDTCMDSRSGQHRLLECLIAHTGQDPSTNPVNGSGDPYWLETGPTNRWAMFDTKNSTQTSNSTSITVDLLPGKIINGLALLNLDADTVQVVVDDPTEGEVYNTTFSTSSLATLNNWYEYFFEEIVPQTELVVLDLPPYSAATITVTISKSTAKCGTLVIGQQKDLGVTLFGTSVSITDYSTKQFDSFGNQTITERNYAKYANYEIDVETAYVREVQRTLAEFRTTPCVWVGDEDYPSTIIYGFYKEFELTLANPIYSGGSITVEGLT